MSLIGWAPFDYNLRPLSLIGICTRRFSDNRKGRAPYCRQAAITIVYVE